MRPKLRSYLIKIAGFFEIFLSFVVLFAIFISSIDLVKSLFFAVMHYIQIGSDSFDFTIFLSAAIQLIIAVEFVKMLSNHSPASAIEVILFVIARRIIISESSNLEMLIGVFALAILFVIRKYLFKSGSRLDDGYLFKADTPVSDVVKICKVHIPIELGTTLAEVVENEFTRLDKTVREREKLVLEDVSILIYAMEDGKITVLEVWNRKSRG